MMHIPVIDLGRDAPTPSPVAPRVIREIDAAARTFGFFQVVGHGIGADLIGRVWEETHRFFRQPRAAKLQLSRTRQNPRGYYDRELTKNARDLKEVFDFAGSFADRQHDPVPGRSVDGSNQWPPLPAFRDTMLAYFDACTALGLTLLEALCTGMGAPADALRACFQPIHTSFVRLNYYPLADPLPPGESAEAPALGDMALHHHTDAGALTILLQDDVGGLQVKVGEAWVDVEPTAGALVINVGDMAQVWSNDRYQAALHRVLPRTQRERYSLPFFFNPSYDATYAPVPTQDGASPRYRPINWGEFRQARTDGDYADFGREIQIEDFRIDGSTDPDRGGG